jgi:hypothetical protein
MTERKEAGMEPMVARTLAEGANARLIVVERGTRVVFYEWQIIDDHDVLVSRRSVDSVEAVVLYALLPVKREEMP